MFITVCKCCRLKRTAHFCILFAASDSALACPALNAACMTTQRRRLNHKNKIRVVLKRSNLTLSINTPHDASPTA